MDDSEVLDVIFDSNYSERESPRDVIHIRRSLDSPEKLLFQFDYNNKSNDDYIYMNVNIEDLMLALGRIFKKGKIEL
ncbi:hypothetical protein LCGC14_1873680 [marine sediment metagenome]|uniref:Uncharacterized protein n=1 Tax=marine sediment metagenome TaxID=412755 RepID=A0A0F9GSB1_9ZZZZ